MSSGSCCVPDFRGGPGEVTSRPTQSQEVLFLILGIERCLGSDLLSLRRTPTEARIEENPNQRTRHIRMRGREMKQPGGPPFTCSSSAVGPRSLEAQSLEREKALAAEIIIYQWDIMIKTTPRSRQHEPHKEGSISSPKRVLGLPAGRTGHARRRRMAEKCLMYKKLPVRCRIEHGLLEED